MHGQNTRYLVGLMLLYCTASVYSATTPLSLLFVRSFCDGEGFESSSVLPAAEMAVERVNSNPSLLQGYSLNLTVTQPIISEDEEVVVCVEGFRQPPEKLAVFYPGCSRDSRVIVDVADSSLFNVTMVTYAFSKLASQSLDFPHHFRMVPSDTYLTDGIVSFILHFGWRRMKMIVEELPAYITIGDKLFVPLADESGVDINVTLLRSDADIGNILETELRIFVLITGPHRTTAILCEAQRQNMTYPGYVWITQGWYSDQWWMEEGTNCTRKEMESFLNGTIAISHFPTASNENDTTDTGITALEFADGYRARTNQSLVPDYAYYVFDAVWATAMALNSASEVNNTGEVRRAFGNLEFTGVSGSVMFEDRSRSLDRLSILQYRQDAKGVLVREEVALIGDQRNFSFLDGESNTSLWPRVPRDGSTIVVENFPRLSLTIICYIYATAGIVFAIICLVFNLVFRKEKLIRLTSPNLNYIIVAGALVFYASVYFVVHPEISEDAVTVFCNISLWLPAIAFSLCYGTINAKMWRVYLICQKPKPSMKKVTLLQDWHLMLIVLLFVMVDLIILTIVTAIDTARYTARIVPDKENPAIMTDDGFRVMFTIKRCYSPNRPYFLGAIYSYKVGLQVIGVLLAFSIRKVKIKGLNDSKEISAIIYITSVLLVVVITITMALGDYVNVNSGVFAVGVSTASTVVLGFLFIPKMVGLYRDPHGKKIFMKNKSTTTTSTETANKITANLKKRVSELEKKLTELQLPKESDPVNEDND